MNKLTEKQRKFCEAYAGPANGNGVQACRLAGYTGNETTLRTQAADNLAKPYLRAEIDRLLQAVRAKAMLDVYECQSILATIARDHDAKHRDKIAAVDKVLKTHGAYIERVEHSGSIDGQLVLSPEVEAALDEWLLIRRDPRVIAVIEIVQKENIE